MADQKSRGGQKEVTGESAGQQQRHVHGHESEPKDGRDMKEDAARGQQGDDGGYNQRPHHQKQSQKD